MPSPGIRPHPSRPGPILLAIVFALTPALQPPALAITEDDPEGTAFFESKIRPVLIEHCFACHSSQAKPPKANFRVDTRAGLRRGGDSGPAIEPGRPDDSLLIRVLEHTSEIAMMPPDRRLPEAILADFRAWIEQGAPDPRPGDDDPKSSGGTP